MANNAATQYMGTPEERRGAIYLGMSQILDEVIERHPHIRYALACDTPEIRAANYQLAGAVNRFITGTITLRKEVRPYFDRAVSEYLMLADEIVLLIAGIIAAAANQALEDYPELDPALETPVIIEANIEFRDANRRLLAGEGNVEETELAFHRMIAAYLEAVTPADLPVDPLQQAA